MLARRALFTLPVTQSKVTTLPPPVFTKIPAPAVQMTPVLQLWNRLSYGPRPEDVERGEGLGYAALLEEQLNPASLDDSACDQIMATFPILFMDRRTAHKLPSPEWRTYLALTIGTVVRAVYSRRQLLERMVEFWSDHFNMPASDYSLHMIDLQNLALRPHALGNFQQMLIAVTKSPAMLYYLDNFANIKDAPNENYARELLELYTLGVDGGYTEQDVKEVARALTGWTVQDGARTGFYFDPDTHDTEAKTVLGHSLPAGRGIDDGYHVLNLVANHPATAQFICRKLCVRFVSDNPPQSLVDSMAAVWREQRGEIKPVLRHLFLSSEFQQAVGQKFRRPLDFFIGALRATGTQVTEVWSYYGFFEDLQQEPYGWHPPNGFPDVAGAWVTAGGMLARWNTAMRLTHFAHSDPNTADGWGLVTQLQPRIGTPATVGQLVDAVSRQVYGATLHADARNFYMHYLTDEPLTTTPATDRPLTKKILGHKAATLFGLMLAAPEYQWR